MSRIDTAGGQKARANPLISVIIPIYNSEKLLNKCVDSVLAQKFVDFELLLINDGSKDSSANICDGYASLDSRVKVFHKENGGVSSARNLGLDQAKGKYICFVDSDDYVSIDFLEDFARNKIDGKEGLVIQGLNFCFKNSRTQIHRFKPIVLEGSDIKKAVSEYKILHYGYPYLKMYSKSMIDKYNIRFDTKFHYCEDVIFTLECLLKSEYIKFVDSVNYYYINDNPASLVKKVYDLDRESKLFEKYKDLLSELKNKFKLTHEEMVYSLNAANRLIYRMIRSAYEGPAELSKANRLESLRTVATEDNISRVKSLPRETIRLRIIQILFVKRKLRLLDVFSIVFKRIQPLYNLVRSFYSKLKYSFNKKPLHVTVGG